MEWDKQSGLGINPNSPQEACVLLSPLCCPQNHGGHNHHNYNVHLWSYDHQMMQQQKLCKAHAPLNGQIRIKAHPQTNESKLTSNRQKSLPSIKQTQLWSYDHQMMQQQKLCKAHAPLNGQIRIKAHPQTNKSKLTLKQYSVPTNKLLNTHQ